MDFGCIMVMTKCIRRLQRPLFDGIYLSMQRFEREESGLMEIDGVEDREKLLYSELVVNVDAADGARAGKDDAGTRKAAAESFMEGWTK